MSSYKIQIKKQTICHSFTHKQSKFNFFKVFCATFFLNCHVESLHTSTLFWLSGVISLYSPLEKIISQLNTLKVIRTKDLYQYVISLMMIPRVICCLFYWWPSWIFRLWFIMMKQLKFHFYSLMTTLLSFHL